MSVIDASEAKVARRAFAEFVAGASPRDIAHGLNTDQVPAPHDGGRGFKGGKGWGFTTVRSMLLNARYVGEVVWNKYKWTKTARGTRQRDLRPEKEWIRSTNEDLAIIDRALWDRAQQRFGSRRTSPAGGARAEVLRRAHGAVRDASPS